MADHVQLCPHCTTMSQFSDFELKFKGADLLLRVTDQPYPDRTLRIRSCRNCFGMIIERLKTVVKHKPIMGSGDMEISAELLYPVVPRPPSLAADVPQNLRDAYAEAWSVKDISEHAAAVLARRCLQLTLRKKGFVAKSLNVEIDAAAKVSGSELATQLHYVREVGNIGAHPMDADGGIDFDQLIEVQPGELIALFAAIREAFDEFFVKPARRQRDLDALNAKLTAAGRQPLKPKS